MKKLLFLITIMLLLVACSEKKPKTTFGEALECKHELLKFNAHSDSNSYTSGWFFLVGGEASSSTTTKNYIRFMWKYNEEYILSELPISLIRIHINDSISIPYIVFKTNPYYYSSNIYAFNLNCDIDEFHINYFTIYCNSTDCPKDINLNFK